jgi:hypothetical protein
MNHHKTIFLAVVFEIRIEGSGLVQIQDELSVSTRRIFTIRGNISRFSSHAQLLGQESELTGSFVASPLEHMFLAISTSRCETEF